MKYDYNKSTKVSDRQFDNIQELIGFITNTPLNKVFMWKTLGSSDSSSSYKEFCKTANFDEAMSMLKNGWDDMAKKLEKQIKLKTRSEVTKTAPRATYSVAGYQACVPRYLQGVPDSMIYSKQVPVKQKVITINKQVNYLSGVTAEEIIEESVKAITVIAKLEAQGYRVQLNAVTCSRDWDSGYIQITRTCIKKPGERLSMAKMAFPLVHPSMLRRIIFRYAEVNPDTPKGWVYSYGSTIYEANKYFEDKANAVYYIPPFVKDVDEFIKNMQLK